MNHNDDVIPPPFADSQIKLAQSNKDRLYEAFIGDKYQSYYQEKFQNLEAPKPKGGFNIAPFLIGPIWLFYRKMYAYGLIYIAVIIVYTIFAEMIEISAAIDRGISIGLAVGMGFAGNGFYKFFVDKKLATSVKTIEDAQQQGGTNPILAWSIMIMLIVLIGIGIFYGG